MIQLFSMFSHLKYVWLKSTSVWDFTIILRSCTTTAWRPGSRPARSTMSLHTGQTAFSRCQFHQHFKLASLFLYESALRSFSLIIVWLCNFLVQKLLIKCWWNYVDEINYSWHRWVRATRCTSNWSRVKPSLTTKESPWRCPCLHLFTISLEFK